MGADPLLRLEGVTKAFGAGSGQTEVLRGVDLTLGAGASVAVVGPSGCGKSTLLNIAGALEPPTSGRVLFAGEDLTAQGPDALAAFRAASLGFVFQHHHLLPQLTAVENALLPALAEPGGSTPSDLRDRAESLLERVGLSGSDGPPAGRPLRRESASASPSCAPWSSARASSSPTSPRAPWTRRTPRGSGIS